MALSFFAPDPVARATAALDSVEPDSAHAVFVERARANVVRLAVAETGTPLSNAVFELLELLDMPTT